MEKVIRFMYTLHPLTVALFLSSCLVILLFPVQIMAEEHTFDYQKEIILPQGFIFPSERDEPSPKEIVPRPLASSSDTVDYLIITDELFWDELKTEFKDWKIARDDKISTIEIVNISSILATTECWVTGTYGDATNESSGNPWIEDGEELTSSFSLFNDTQAKMRNFIRMHVSLYGTKFVLLAGNKDIVPVRMFCSYAHSGPSGRWYNDTSHASDMYYSCLENNFNDNLNTRWGENTFGDGVFWANVSAYDNIDWTYDVTVGRVLAETEQEMIHWINKTKAYVESNEQTYLQSGIVASKDTSNKINSYVWSQIGDEFPENITFVNGKNITQEQWNIIDDYCNGEVDGFEGIGLLYHSGHGGTLYTPYRGSSLNNANAPNFLYTEGCGSANFGSTTGSRMEEWLSDDGGAVAGIANSAYGWFIASTWYSEEMFDLMFNSGSERCFAKAHDQARENIGWELHSVAPMIVKETNYFGDPALEFNWYEIEPESQSPVFSNEYPSNGTININTSLNWQIDIEDESTFDVNISCSNGQWAIWDNQTNNTFSLELTALENNTYYIVTVWAQDEENNTEEQWFTFRTRPETYPVYDINEDGYTNYLDISLLVSNYGESGAPGWIPEDINDDGTINYLDISSLISHYGESY